MRAALRGALFDVTAMPEALGLLYFLTSALSQAPDVDAG